MKEQEIKLIKDLYNHFQPQTDVTDELINSFYNQYGSIRGILMNLVLKFQPKAEVTDEYLDKKLSDYGIQSEKIKDDTTPPLANSKIKLTKETSEVEPAKEQESLQEKTKEKQKEIAASDSNKKSKTGLIVTLLIVGIIGVIGFLNQDILLEQFSINSATDSPIEKLDNYRIESDIIRENVNAIDNSENKNDEIINDIRDDFYYLKNNWVNLKRISLSDNITIYSTLEYPSLNNHFCAQILNEGINYEFYVNNEKLYFVYSHFEGIENRYYFNPNGEIIMWLDSEKAEVKDGLLAEKNSLNLIFEEIYFNTETNDIKKSNLLGIINDPDGYTNVRADKSSSSSVIYEIYDENKRFEIIDDSGEWWKIKFDIDEYPYEIIGFIHNSRVELIDNSEVDEQLDLGYSTYAKSNVSNLNVRSTPEISDNVIGMLQLGDRVEVLGVVKREMGATRNGILNKETLIDIAGSEVLFQSGKVFKIIHEGPLAYRVIADDRDHEAIIDKSNIDLIEREVWLLVHFLNQKSRKTDQGYVYQKFLTSQKEVEEDVTTEEKANETDKYYKIQDPDGYTNMRDAPAGSIIRRVLPNEKFRVSGVSGKYKVVKFDNGETGYIHNSRIVKY